MAEARTYLTDELEQKVPQKILSFFVSAKGIKKGEPVMAVFGGTQLLTITSSAVSTADRIEYWNSKSARLKTLSNTYADLAEANMAAEGSTSFIDLTRHDGETTRLDIPAAPAETEKFYHFIRNHCENGTDIVTPVVPTAADKASQRKIELNAKIAELQREREKLRKENTPEARSERVREIKEAGQRKIAAQQAATAQEIKEHEAKAEQYRLENTPEARAKRTQESNDKIKQMKTESQQRLAAIDESTAKKLDEITKKRNLATYQLNYCSGFDASVPAGTIKVHMDGFKQHFELTFANGFKMLLPFVWIKGSEIVPEKEVPPDDYTNEYVYYLKISCEISGQPCELILSHTHKQGLPMDPVRLLHVTIQELPNKIGAFNQRNAYYDQRAQELAAERERLLAQRSGQVAEIRNLFSGGSPAVQPAAPQPAVAPTADPIETIKKYKELLDQGILTQEEFDTKKKQLLGL